jgi:hypothetical protein
VTWSNYPVLWHKNRTTLRYDRRLPGFGIHILLSGRVRDGTTICDAWQQFAPTPKAAQRVLEFFTTSFALNTARIVSCVLTTVPMADALSRYLEPRVYQRNRAHLCLPGPVIHPRPERTRRQAPRLALQTACRRRFANNVPRGVKTRERRREPTTLSARPRTLERRRWRCLRRSSRLEGGHVFQQVMRYFGLHLWSVPRF